MHLVDPSMQQKEKIRLAAQGLLLVIAFFFSVFWVTFMGLHREEDRIFQKNNPLPQLDYNKIGHGVLALELPTQSPALMQELVLMGKNSRPDSCEAAAICLGLKTSGSKREAVCGQKLFLTQQGSSFKFTEANSDFSITPLSLNSRGVVLQIERGEAREEIVLTPSSIFQRSLDDEDYTQSLKKGKLWGPDMFLQQWGGDEYSSLSSKLKVEIGSKVYFLLVGDTLWWDGDAWREGIAKAPLARVVLATSQGVKVEVWDEIGYASSVILLPLQQAAKGSAKQDEIMTAVRSRSPSEITCQMGKRRVTVKEGDWWVRADGRWRSLKNTYDLEAFLRHEIQGELFIFDKIENGKERITLKGRSFDKMRTESQPISLVFNTDKKAPSHPKKEISRASLFAKNKVAVPRVQHQNGDGEEKQ